MIRFGENVCAGMEVEFISPIEGMVVDARRAFASAVYVVEAQFDSFQSAAVIYVEIELPLRARDLCRLEARGVDGDQFNFNPIFGSSRRIRALCLR